MNRRRFRVRGDRGVVITTEVVGIRGWWVSHGRLLGGSHPEAGGHPAGPSLPPLGATTSALVARSTLPVRAGCWAHRVGRASLDDLPIVAARSGLAVPVWTN